LQRLADSFREPTLTPSVDSLAALLSGFECAMLTLIDAEGHPHTRPMRPVKAPFNGHLWFRLGDDAAAAAQIGRGAEVSVAYGGAANGPYVTVYGWAIVLRNPPQVRSVWRAAGAAAAAQPALSGPLVCVCARAAEVWDASSSASRRVFAFAAAHAHPVWQDAAPAQERAFTPRLVAMSTTSCAS
jgi:general stress protein 26